MKLSQRLVIVWAGSALALAPLAVAGAPAARAAGVSHCHIHGIAQLNPGISPGTPSTGSYAFVSTTIACGGTVVAGTAAANSNGSYTDDGVGGLFSGTFSTSAFLIGGSCSGSVSGSRTGTVVRAGLDGSCGGVAGHAEVVLNFTPGCATVPPASVPVTCATLDGSAEIVTS